MSIDKGGEPSKTDEDEGYERVFEIIPKDKDKKGNDRNVLYWYIRRPLVKLKFYLKKGKVASVQGLRVKCNEKNTYLTQIVGKKPKKYEEIEVDLPDEVTNFSVSYFKTGGKLAKLSIETTKKSYSIGDSGCYMVKERKTNVLNGTFDGIYGYNTGGREGKIRSIGLFKDKEEIL
ncbi:hypothetical protein Tco_1179093 [Tanacetum coccineum]